MKATVFVRSAIALAIISVTGCSTWDSMSKTGQATTVAATSGAVGGAVVGGPVGAVVGAAIGGVAAHEMAKSDSTKPTTARSDSSSTYTNDTAAGGPANSTASGGTYLSNSSNSANAADGSNRGAASSDSNSTKTTAANGHVPSTGSESAALRSMSHEADIRAVQQSLNDHGYDAGNVDGVWGPRSAAAVRKFQIDRGLQATGRLDAETRTALGVSNGAVSSLPSQVSSAAQ